MSANPYSLNPGSSESAPPSTGGAPESAAPAAPARAPAAPQQPATTQTPGQGGATPRLQVVSDQGKANPYSLNRPDADESGAEPDVTQTPGQQVAGQPDADVAELDTYLQGLLGDDAAPPAGSPATGQPAAGGEAGELAQIMQALGIAPEPPAPPADPVLNHPAFVELRRQNEALMQQMGRFVQPAAAAQQVQRPPAQAQQFDARGIVDAVNKRFGPPPDAAENPELFARWQSDRDATLAHYTAEHAYQRAAAEFDQRISSAIGPSQQAVLEAHVYNRAEALAASVKGATPEFKERLANEYFSAMRRGVNIRPFSPEEGALVNSTFKAYQRERVAMLAGFAQSNPGFRPYLVSYFKSLHQKQPTQAGANGAGTAPRGTAPPRKV